LRRSGRQTNLSTALSGIIARLDRKSGGAYSLTRVTAVWEEIAGAVVSGHTTGSHMRQGTLVIYVDSPIWATELTAMSEQYRSAINDRLGQELVRAMRFDVSKRVLEAKAEERQAEELDGFYDADVVDSVALTDMERAQVESSVSVIKDPELREAVLRATVRDMEWKKGLAARNAREAASESV